MEYKEKSTRYAPISSENSPFLDLKVVLSSVVKSVRGLPAFLVLLFGFILWFQVIGNASTLLLFFAMWMSWLIVADRKPDEDDDNDDDFIPPPEKFRKARPIIVSIWIALACIPLTLGVTLVSKPQIVEEGTMFTTHELISDFSLYFINDGRVVRVATFKGEDNSLRLLHTGRLYKQELYEHRNLRCTKEYNFVNANGQFKEHAVGAVQVEYALDAIPIRAPVPIDAAGVNGEVQLICNQTASAIGEVLNSYVGPGRTFECYYELSLENEYRQELSKVISPLFKVQIVKIGQPGYVHVWPDQKGRWDENEGTKAIGC